MLVDIRGGGDSDDSQAASDSSAMMEDYLKKAGVDGDKLEELMSSMKGPDGKIPSMDESMKTVRAVVVTI